MSSDLDDLRIRGIKLAVVCAWCSTAILSVMTGRAAIDSGNVSFAYLLAIVTSAMVNTVPTIAVLRGAAVALSDTAQQLLAVSDDFISRLRAA